MDNQDYRKFVIGLFEKYIKRLPKDGELQNHLHKFDTIHKFNKDSLTQEFATCPEAALTSKIILLGWVHSKRFFVDYIDAIIANSDNIGILWIDNINEYFRLSIKNKIVVHIQYFFFQIENDNDNIHVMLNTESFRNNPMLKNSLINYPNAYIIDHSIANIVDAIREYPHIKHHMYHIPYQINPSELLGITKDKNVIMSCITTHRRKIASEPIIVGVNKYLANKNSSVDFIKGWGHLRDVNTYDHKILVSINSYDNMSQISCFRTDRCVFNRMIVIQEIPDNDINNYDDFVHPELQNLMIFEKLSNICQKTIEILENYDHWYHKLFDGVNFDDLRIKLKFKIDDTFSKINMGSDLKIDGL